MYSVSRATGSRCSICSTMGATHLFQKRRKLPRSVSFSLNCQTSPAPHRPTRLHDLSRAASGMNFISFQYFKVTPAFQGTANAVRTGSAFAWRDFFVFVEALLDQEPISAFRNCSFPFYPAVPRARRHILCSQPARKTFPLVALAAFGQVGSRLFYLEVPGVPNPPNRENMLKLAW